LKSKRTLFVQGNRFIENASQSYGNGKWRLYTLGTGNLM